MLKPLAFLFVLLGVLLLAVGAFALLYSVETSAWFGTYHETVYPYQEQAPGVFGIGAVLIVIGVITYGVAYISEVRHKARSR